MPAMYAARFPAKVTSLVLAGAPIDTDAGDGPVERMAHTYPAAFYEELVALGGGLMRGEIMLKGWQNMHPEQHYFQNHINHIDLYEHIDDRVYLDKKETFERWYENPNTFPAVGTFKPSSSFLKKTGWPRATLSVSATA
jgi:poly(3-hydroxybutyrate) depolymerase